MVPILQQNLHSSDHFIELANGGVIQKQTNKERKELIESLKKSNESLRNGNLQKYEINFDEYAGYFGGTSPTSAQQQTSNSPQSQIAFQSQQILILQKSILPQDLE